jgi:hypothetical protein
MSLKEGCKRIARRAVGGTSATVASKSQIRPLRTVIHISEFASTTASGNCHHRTCFQSLRPKAKAPPRRGSKPMSMIRSKPMSETREQIIAGLVLSMLSTTQVSASGDHVERSYGCQVSQAGPKQLKLKIHPYCTYDITRYTRASPVICRRYLPLMKSKMSVTHMLIAIAIIIFALFQMAILPSYLERIASGGGGIVTHGVHTKHNQQ